MWVATVSREWSRERESQKWVANVGREGVSQMGVAKWGHENKKIGGVCKWDPEGKNYLIKKCIRNK